MHGLTGMAAFYGLPIYLEALTREGRFTSGQVAGATAMYFVMMAVWSVPVGQLVLRWRLGGVVLLGSVTFALAQVLLALSPSLAGLWLAYVLLAFASVACGPVPATALVLRWFPIVARQQVSVVISGQSLFGALLTPVLASMVLTRGFAPVMLVNAALHLVVVGLVVGGICWRHDRPREITGCRTGVVAPSRGERPGSRRARRRDAPGAMRSRRPGADRYRPLMVWLSVMALAGFIGLNGALTHIYVFASERRIPAAVAVMSVIAGTALLYRIAFTALPRIGPWALGLVLHVAVLCTLLAFQLVQSSMALLLSAAVLGMSAAVAPLVVPLMVAEFTSADGFTGRAAVVSTFSSAGSAIGVYFVEVIRSASSYEVAFAVLIMPTLIGLAALFALRRYIPTSAARIHQERIPPGIPPG